MKRRTTGGAGAQRSRYRITNPASLSRDGRTSVRSASARGGNGPSITPNTGGVINSKRFQPGSSGGNVNSGGGSPV